MGKKEKTIQRLYELLELQKKIEKQFYGEYYNIFVFGSYITTDYIDGISDIDIAIYTEDIDIYKKLALYIENHFNKLNIKSDIFYIDTSIAAPIYCMPLSSPIQFTEYFPDKLKTFYIQCNNELQSLKEKVSIWNLTKNY